MKTLAILIAAALMTTGCTLLMPQNPYEAGERLAEDYIIAQSYGHEEAVEAAELAYEALKELVDGPSPTLDNDALELIIIDIALANGVPSHTTKLALVLGKRGRRILRRILGQSPTIRRYHEALSELKRGIDDTLEEYDK